MEESLAGYLLSATALSALVASRIYWVRAPQGVSKPYVLLTLIGSPRDMKMSGPSGLRMSRVQIDCCGLTYTNTKGVARAVEVRLSGFRGTAGTTTFDGVFLDSERDGLEDGDTPDDLARVSMDFLIWHKET